MNQVLSLEFRPQNIVVRLLSTLTSGFPVPGNPYDARWAFIFPG